MTFSLDRFGTSDTKSDAKKVTRTTISKARILRISGLAVAERNDPVRPAGFEQEALVVCAQRGHVELYGNKERVKPTIYIKKCPVSEGLSFQNRIHPRRNSIIQRAMQG